MRGVGDVTKGQREGVWDCGCGGGCVIRIVSGGGRESTRFDADGIEIAEERVSEKVRKEWEGCLCESEHLESEGVDKGYGCIFEGGGGGGVEGNVGEGEHAEVGEGVDVET